MESLQCGVGPQPSVLRNGLPVVGGWVGRGKEGVVMVTGELLWRVIVCADVDKPEVGGAMIGRATEPVTVCVDPDVLATGIA